MSYVVWDCCPVDSWRSYETLAEARKATAGSGVCGCGQFMEIEEDVQMPANRYGLAEQYPRSDSDYESMGDLPPIGALKALYKYFTVGGGQWGHTPHWLSAGLAAIADGDEERAKKCLAIAFGYKDAMRGEERNALFATSGLLEPNDFAAVLRHSRRTQ